MAVILARIPAMQAEVILFLLQFLRGNVRTVS